MVNIGIIGIGFMGMTHFKAVTKIKGAKVTALCTRNPKKLEGDWRDIKGNFGDDGGIQDLTHVRKYTEIGDILADPDLDLIDICLPTHLHAEVAASALDAKRHVLVEKPIALTLEDADRMIQTANRVGKLLMVGQVLRFFPEFALLKDIISQGRYGKVVGAHLKRIIAKPSWGSFDTLELTGGAGIDLHIHDADFVHYAFGMPGAVFSSGVTTQEHVDYLTTCYLYPDRDTSISVSSGWIAMPGLMFEHGYDVYLEEATIQYNSQTGQAPTLYTKDGEKSQPMLQDQDAFQSEIACAVACVEQGRASKMIDGESARRSLLLCLREAESVKTHRVVQVP